MSQRATARVVIQNRLGLHARPAMSFVDLASSSSATVTVCGNGQEVDGKSIMQMLMLAATQGTELEIIAEGDDAEDIVEKLKGLVDDRFGED
ncbi:MAG: HPr family phosphocarrier protein [Planctomycetota bacterium]|nr:HPr family phosphocarrier protein [Planctomycetota bacterium]